MGPAITHAEVDSEDGGTLVVRWEFEGEGLVDIAVGPTPEAIDHKHALTVPAGERLARLHGSGPARRYVSVAPHDGGSAVVAAERQVRFEGLENFRDLGGYRTNGGQTTRWGRVFRSDGLHRLTPGDLVSFEALGLRVIYDLRAGHERDLEPDPMISVHVAIESGVPESGSSEMALLQSVNDGENRLRDHYQLLLTNAGPLFGQILTGLVRPHGLPAVFHCAAGKDRTGLTAALLLSWLGVDRETVLDDYELTSRYRSVARVERVIGMFVHAGMSSEAAAGMVSTPRWVMAEALSTLDDEHGGIENYLRGPAETAPATLSQLRQLLLD